MVVFVVVLAQSAAVPDDKPEVMLYHERLDVYRLSIQFVAAAVAVSERIPRGHAPLADQLRRAAISIPLNIAEGVGKPSKAEQADRPRRRRRQGPRHAKTITTTTERCWLLTPMGVMGPVLKQTGVVIDAGALRSELASVHAPANAVVRAHDRAAPDQHCVVEAACLHARR